MQPDGLALFVPLTKGDHRGSQHSRTPCRKERGVPLAKGDKLSLLAREMYKLEAAAGGRPNGLWPIAGETPALPGFSHYSKKRLA